MGIVPIALGTQSSPSRHPAAGNARLINCRMEPSGDEAKVPNQIWGCAGFKDYQTLSGDAGIRCLFVSDGVLIAVAGRSVSRILPGGSAPVVIGGIPTTGPVYAARNRRTPTAQVALVSDGLYYLYEGAGLTAVSDSALPSPTSVDFLDGYFFFSEERGRITRSELDNGGTFDGLAYASAESNPDKLLRVITHERMLVAFGERSTEFFVADASVDPFAYSRSTAIEVGCAAAGSVARVQQTIIWIADDKTVRRLNGYQGVKISSYPVDRFIQSIPDLTQVSAFTYTLNGNTYYTLNAPNGTWEYCLTTGLWHERKSYGLNRWRVSCAVEFDGKIIVGDYNSPKLYEMSEDYYSEADQPLVCVNQTPPAHAFPYYLLIPNVFIDVVPGVGLPETRNPITTVPGNGTPIGLLLALTFGTGSTTTGGDINNAWLSDPCLLLDYSDDGGINFKPTRSLRVGKDGQTTTRVKTLRLGRTKAQGRTYRIVFSAAVARGLLGMGIEPTKLNP